VTNLLICDGHGIPSSYSFGADGSLGYVWSQVVCDDGARRLHVEEVWSQRSLGRIGIMSSLLLGRLGFSCCWNGRAGSAESTESTEERIVQEAGFAVCASVMFAKDGICVLEVAARDCPALFL
jgi:hypothetical protein